MENELVDLFKKSVALSEGSRLQKLIKIPKRAFFLKILEYLCLFFRSYHKIHAKTFWDEEMVVIVPEVVSSSIYKYGYTEEGLTRMVLDKLKSGMIFFDVGAHFGYFTLLASLIVGNKGQVHSFEPTQTTFNILKENVSNKRNVFLNNCAVFSENKTVFLSDHGIRYSAFNSLLPSRLPQKNLSSIKVTNYSVDCITIDDYVVASRVLPDFVKIDAESAEYQILQGMDKTIEKCRPIISIEVGDLAKEATLSKNLVEFLICKNYQPYEYKEGTIKFHMLKDGFYEFDNLLFLPGK